ncbi:uncharacterized protein LOC125051147 isoform X1 [Pieris napi]|uniref:uncharacterized protein LOC125051147 isoform X1 n=1 Tax=Pieris napi TaxID=78633 RepID=UPI001FB972E4|nr:uncharacterized protein LOC125051147 isoform X1 [Pieris napi]
MSSGDQEEQRNRLIRSMFVNLQPLNSPQRETAEEVYSNAPPTPELTIEYVRLRNDDDELTDPERLENYIKTLRAESEAKKKQRRVDDDISTDELEENDDSTDNLDNRSLEEVRRRTTSWEYSPILQRFSDSPRHPALLTKSPSSPEQQTNLRRSSRKRKKVEFRSMNLSTTPERPSTSRPSRQKEVSRRPSAKFRRTVNTRTIGTQTVDYWFNMLMDDYCEYDIIPRQQAQ